MAKIVVPGIGREGTMSMVTHSRPESAPLKWSHIINDEDKEKFDEDKITRCMCDSLSSA
jgi:hypothetical protein